MHQVSTKDDYILGLFRIVGTPSRSCSNSKAVILAHGILCSSTDWVITGPRKALAYQLADLGYDVWMINFRGNRYSRKHVHLTDAEDAFWNFSWQEMGEYDIPAALDYVLSINGGDKLKFVCHSMGCTSLLVTLSEHPQYNEKIESVNMMAPISIMNHSHSVLHNTAKVLDNMQDADVLLGRKEVDSKVAESLWGEMCRKEITFPIVCTTTIFLLTGWNADTLINSGVFREAMQHQQGGLSSKTLIHYSQVITTGKFSKFSYTEEENMFRYGSEDPPEFNIKHFLVPATITYGLNDVMANLRDVNWLASALPSKPEKFMAPTQINHHMDFVWGEGCRHSLYAKIIHAMNT